MLDQNEISISFAYPDPGSVKSCFHHSVIGMTLYETSKDPNNSDGLIKNTRHLGSFLHQTPGCYVSINRSKIVEDHRFKSQDTHVLMIDPDISFQPNILDIIVAHLVSFEEIDCLAGRVNINNGYPVFYKNEFGGLVQQVQPFYGVKEFDSVGTGIIVLSRKMLDDLCSKEGHGSLFLHKLVTGREHGDDHSFCMRVKEHGYKIYGAWAIEGKHLKENFVPSRYPTSLEEVAPGFKS